MRKEDAITTLGCALLALLGGAARELNSIGEKKLNFKIFTAQLFVSLFTGVIVGLFCIHFEVSQIIAFAICGLSGFGGVTVLNLLIEVGKTKLLATEVKKEDLQDKK